MIVDILLIILFAVLLNWSVNLQILFQFEKNPRSRLIAFMIGILASIALGIIIRV